MRNGCAIALPMLLFASIAQSQDLPRIFMTSVKGSGNLSSWDDAHGFSGLEAGDEICRSRAAFRNIPNPEQYVALLSSSVDDAYCRLHGLHGKRSGNCGLAQLPSDAGPWYRMDGLASWDTPFHSMPDDPVVGYIPRHVLFDESGSPVANDDVIEHLAFTGTSNDGRAVSDTCSDWTNAGTGAWTYAMSAYLAGSGQGHYSASCGISFRLACAAKGAHGQALRRVAPASDRVAFVTSTLGRGNLGSWIDAAGASGLAAGDAICRAHAARGGLARAASFKAWLSTSNTHAKDRFEWEGPWYRPDGVRIAVSMPDLLDGEIEAPLQIDEAGKPTGYSVVWTGTTPAGEYQATPVTDSCNDWTSASSGNGAARGLPISAMSDWTADVTSSAGCSSNLRLFCFADNDSLFVSGFH